MGTVGEKVVMMMVVWFDPKITWTPVVSFPSRTLFFALVLVVGLPSFGYKLDPCILSLYDKPGGRPLQQMEVAGLVLLPMLGDSWCFP